MINPLPILKVSTWALGVAAAAIVVMDPTVKVAIIAAIPPLVSSFLWGWANHRKISTVEVNTNDKLSRLLDERNAATTRADTLQGQKEGIKGEQDRTTKGT
jgi:hypothetical protein